MSCEDDDYGWDDPVPVIEKIVHQIEMDCISSCEILLFEKGLIKCLEQKLEKLNIVSGQMNVCALEGHLLVNDRYHICPEFVRIVEGFGMDIKQITVPGMRGKTYLISDEIVAILQKLSSKYFFGESVANMKTTVAMEQVVKNALIAYPTIDKKYDGELVSYIAQILQSGTMSVEGVETIVDGVSQGVVSNVDSVQKKLEELIHEIERQVARNNQNMQHGTTEILCYRARQMGYSVQRNEEGKVVQLVLIGE